MTEIMRTRRNVFGDIPFLGSNLISFIKDRIRPGSRILEFGSGASTVWFAEMDAKVISFEHSDEWALNVLSRLKKKGLEKNVCLIYMPKYPSEMITVKGMFDMIFIDGRKRVQCIEKYHASVKLKGALVLDNSEVEKWKTGVDLMDSLGWKRIDFQGFRARSKSSAWIRENG